LALGALFVAGSAFDYFGNATFVGVIGIALLLHAGWEWSGQRNHQAIFLGAPGLSFLAFGLLNVPALPGTAYYGAGTTLTWSITIVASGILTMTFGIVMAGLVVRGGLQEHWQPSTGVLAVAVLFAFAFLGMGAGQLYIASGGGSYSGAVSIAALLLFLAAILALILAALQARESVAGTSRPMRG